MVDELPLDERKAAILRAIVSHYVTSGEPVGSKTLVDRYGLKVSPATVRNEMGALEDAGFIFQPHTSAGRIPTDIGYRYFVDAWARHVDLPANDARKVKRFFGEPRWELEDALRETASLLSSMTDHAAVVFAPALDKSVVRRLELVRLSGDKVMLLLVTDTGRVENLLFTAPEVDDVHIDQTMEMLNRFVDGVPLHSAASTLESSVDRLPLELRDLARLVTTVVEKEMAEDPERVFLEGTSNIVDETKFADIETVREVVGALEHRRVIMEVLADALSSETVSVKIGTENTQEGMRFCSVITAAYGAEGLPIGSLGVVGPTRMDYQRSIAAVHEVASSLGRMLAELGL